MITLDSVSKSYAKGQPAVNNVSLHIEKGEFVFIVGNSGSGKSTLIKLLLKELEPTSGTIKVNGQILNKMKRWRVPKYRRGVGVVFQDFRLLKEPDVYENVAFAQRVNRETEPRHQKARAGSPDAGRNWQRSTNLSRRSFPEESSSELPWQEPLSTGLTSFLRTSRPETWTRETPWRL